MQISFERSLWPASKDAWLALEPETYLLLYDIFVVSGVHKYARFSIKAIPEKEDRFLVVSVSSKDGNAYVHVRILEIWDSVESISDHLAVPEDRVKRYLREEGYLIEEGPGYSFEDTLVLPSKLSDEQFEQLFQEIAVIEGRFIEHTRKAWDSVLSFCEQERQKAHTDDVVLPAKVSRLLSELGYESDDPLTVSRLVEVLEDMVAERKEHNGWCS